MAVALQPWSVRAVNLPEHADNPVHTDAGGRAAGYSGAVVAGTTVYAYLARPVLDAWGERWAGDGTAEVRFVDAVIEGSSLDLVPSEDDGGWTVTALVDGRRGAALRVGLGAEPPPPPTGTRLEPMVAVLDEGLAGYARRVGAASGPPDAAHPVVWPVLANRLFATQLVDGPWIHTRSAVRHVASVRPGATVVVEAWLVDRFSSRAGERAVVDLRFTVDDRLVAAVEHEAVVRVATR